MVARRFFMLALSFCLVVAVGVMRVDNLFAQGEAKKEAQPPKTECSKNGGSQARHSESC